jgi:hypothetical protein
MSSSFPLETTSQQALLSSRDSMKDDPSVPRQDANYPSLLPPSAPPMAQPAYHYANQAPQQHMQYHQQHSSQQYHQPPPAQQYVAPHQQPLVQQLPPPVAVVYNPLPHSGDYRKEGCCGMVFKLFVFHLMNAILGIAAFVVVVVGVSTSIGLLPLCCFGIVIFRLVLYVVRFCAQLDVELYNYISPQEEHVYVSIPERAAFYGLEGQRLAPSLMNVSPLSLMATLYFLTIKYALGVISLVILVTSISLPLGGKIAVASGPDTTVLVMGIDMQEFNFETDPFGFTVACLCMFVISLALMHIAARLSRAATRFFCCERFSTYRYVQTAYDYPTTAQYPSATAAYGSTSTY